MYQKIESAFIGAACGLWLVAGLWLTGHLPSTPRIMVGYCVFTGLMLVWAAALEMHKPD